jgi:hypothetical protein
MYHASAGGVTTIPAAAVITRDMTEPNRQICPRWPTVNLDRTARGQERAR